MAHLTLNSKMAGKYIETEIGAQAKVDAHEALKTNPHAVTKAQVGLGNADNTADSAKNVLSATKLTTARTISLTGGVTGSVSFDGSGNVNIASVITQDASNRFATDAEKTTWNAKASTTVVTTTVNGLMAFADKVKLDGISTGANKTESSTTNGNIKIDGVEKVVYTPPTTTPATGVVEDSTHRFVTDAEKTTWNAKQNALVVYREKYFVPVGGLAKDANLTIPASRSYVVGSDKLRIYRDGQVQDVDTNSTAKDNDYWEVSTTQVRFNYNIPADSIIIFEILV